MTTRQKILATATMMMVLSLPFARAGAETNTTAIPAGGAGQLTIPRIEEMSNCPDQFQVIDWNRMARGFADLAFDLEAKGPDMPLVWLDKSHSNYPEDTFGLYVVVGDPRCGPRMANGTYHDALCDIGAVYAASLTGLDMTNYKGRNWVKMCRAFFNKSNGRNVFMEYVREFERYPGGGYGIDFWLDTFPSVLAMQVAACYPQEESLHEPLRVTCGKFYEASRILLATPEKFDWCTFDFKEMKPKNTRVSRQPGTAAGYATLLYWAASRFGEPKYLEAALSCMDYLDTLTENPSYDIFQSYSVYVMARANAEHGRHYDVPKHLKWTFQGGVKCVEGVHAGKWGDYDMSGLVEMREVRRVYLLETFLDAQCLLPAVRYDARLARTVGKWMQNAASNARYFYPGYLPKEHMVNPDIGATRGVIASEALTARSMYGKFPVPTAETDDWKDTYTPEGKLVVWPKSRHRSLYGSGYAGIFGAVISRTSDEKVLQLDLLKTDFYRGKAYPTYLFYNPYADDKDISIDVGDKPVDLYDAVTHAFIKHNVKGATSLNLMKDSAKVIVMAPAAGRRSEDGHKLSVDGVVIDYACPPQAK